MLSFWLATGFFANGLPVTGWTFSENSDPSGWLHDPASAPDALTFEQRPSLSPWPTGE